VTPNLMASPEWKRLKAVISEVINNHDFPTEPGTANEFGNCEIFDLFKTLEENF
jgi:hypothetical protein